jgi:hypothetical protein
MNLPLALGYPLLVVAGLEVLLGSMLLRQNPRDSRVLKAVAAFSFFSAAFSLSTALMYLRASSGLDHIPFARLSWIGWFSIPAALQFVFYLRNERSDAGRLIGWVLYPFWGVVFGLCLFTNLIVTDHYQLIPFENRPGPVENPVRFIGGSLILWLMIEIYRFRRQVAGIKRAQLNYFFAGTLIFATCGSLTAGFLQLFGGLGFEPGLAAYFSFPWVVLTFYAITRYRLFDMRLILSNALGAGLLFLLVAAAQSGLFHLLAPAAGTTLALLFSLAIPVLVFFGSPFGNRLRAVVRRTLLQDRFLHQDVLRESVKAIVTILDFDEVLAYLVDTIRKTLQAGGAAIYLKGADGTISLRHGAGVTTPSGEAAPLDPCIAELADQAGQAIVREELGRILPDQTFGELNASLRSIDAEVVVPLRSKGFLSGVLTVSGKGNGGPYLRSDLDLLDALAGHAVIAIENARLYDEARRARDSLRESEARLTTLVEHSIQKYLSQ